MKDIYAQIRDGDIEGVLNLESNKIGDEGAKTLSEALKSENCKLTSVHLKGNKIGAEGAKELAEALKSENCKLTSVNLEYNDIEAEGAKELAEALKSENCKLTSVNLESNDIGAEGAKELAEALKSENCKLTSVDLKGNKIRDEGAKALFSYVDNCVINKIDITYIGDKQVSEYINLIKGITDSAFKEIVIQEHIAKNIEYEHIKKLVNDKADKAELITHNIAQYNTNNVEAVQYLVNLKDKNDVSLVDINKKINGSAIVTYYRDNPEMLEFLLSHGGRYELIAGESLEAKIANDIQSTHANSDVNKLCKINYNNLKEFVEGNGEIKLDYDNIKELLVKLSESPEITDILGVKIDTENLKDAINEKISSFTKMKCNDYKNFTHITEINKGEYEKIINNYNNNPVLFFKKAVELLDAAKNISSTFEGQNVGFQEALELTFKSIVKIADQTKDSIVPNMLDAVCELVDIATMYSPNGSSCSDGVVKKTLSIMSNKHKDLVIDLKYIKDTESSINIHDLPYAELTLKSYMTLTPKQQLAFYNTHLVEVQNNVNNDFNGAIYKVLAEKYSNQIAYQDVARVQQCILNMDGNNIPKYSDLVDAWINTQNYITNHEYMMTGKYIEYFE